MNLVKRRQILLSLHVNLCQSSIKKTLLYCPEIKKKKQNNKYNLIIDFYQFHRSALMVTLSNNTENQLDLTQLSSCERVELESSKIFFYFERKRFNLL